MTTTPLPATMRAISVRVPWTWYLLYAGKDIENRGLRIPRAYCGRALLHASKWWNQEEMDRATAQRWRSFARRGLLREGSTPS
jgi:hypothetical protein